MTSVAQSGVTADEKDQKWLKLIEEWRESGLTAAEWVRERGDVSYDPFMKARNRLFPEEGRRGEFLEKETTWSAVTMEIPSSSLDVFIHDCRVSVKSGFDQELLLEVLEVLRRADES